MREVEAKSTDLGTALIHLKVKPAGRGFKHCQVLEN